MLSFFGKKKIIVENPSSEQAPPIQGPLEDSNNGDEFIFVERRNPINPQPNTMPTNNSMYPNVPGGRVPASYPSTPKDDSNTDNSGPVSYIQGVPFVLCPQLADQNQTAGSSIEIDRILAILTRQMSVDEEMNDYNFTLEKSVLNAI